MPKLIAEFDYRTGDSFRIVETKDSSEIDIFVLEKKTKDSLDGNCWITILRVFNKPINDPEGLLFVILTQISRELKAFEITRDPHP